MSGLCLCLLVVTMGLWESIAEIGWRKWFAGLLVVSVAVVSGTVWLQRRSVRRVVSQPVENHVCNLLDLIAEKDTELDDTFDSDIFGCLFDGEVDPAYDIAGAPLEATQYKRPHRRRVLMTVKARVAVYEKHGKLSDSPANRLMISDTIRKFLKDSGVRPTHILQITPIVIELCFIPTKPELLAAEIQASSTKRGLIEQSHNWFPKPQLLVEHLEYFLRVDLSRLKPPDRRGQPCVQ